jgi:hypothetical protein
MTERDLDQLRHRIRAGEKPTGDLWALRNNGLQNGIGEDRAEAVSDVWNLVFHHESGFPKLEAAKALVETALAVNISYPILTNDGLIYDALSGAERVQLARFIHERLLEADAPVARDLLDAFAGELVGGPQV